MKVGISLFVMSLAAVTLSAAVGPDVPVQDRAKGAQKVVVGTTSDVWSAFEVNKYGDRLIVSHVTVDVEETMKGRADAQVSLKVEGGTIGDLTLQVSDMPAFVRGQRAVLFLEQTGSSEYALHRRGLGVMRLNNSNQVTGTNLTLNTVRSMVRQANAQ